MSSFGLLGTESSVYPNDVLFGQQWYLYNDGQFGGVPGSDVGALGAWSIANTSPNVVVAVLDSGIQLDHPDLKDNIWINQNEIPGNNIDDDNNNFTDDVTGWSYFSNSTNQSLFEGPIAHGTHVAGTIGATGDNGIGITGVTWDVQIMPLEVSSYFPFTMKDEVKTYLYDPKYDNFGSAIRYAVDNGASVINVSQGKLFDMPYDEWQAEYPIFHQWRFDALQYAVDNGVTVVFAAGNEQSEIGQNKTIVPGYLGEMLEGVINVGAITDTGEPTFYTNYGDFIDLSAPGGNGADKIGQDERRDVLSTNKNDSYELTFGTSTAAPLVTGTIALMLGIDPSLTPARVEQILKESATKSKILAEADKRLGDGLVLDIESALRMTRESLKKSS